jgi:hypothetical protein
MNAEDAKARGKEILGARSHERKEIAIRDLTANDAHGAREELVLIADGDKRRTENEKVAKIEKEGGSRGGNGPGNSERSSGGVPVHGFLHSELMSIRID